MTVFAREGSKGIASLALLLLGLAWTLPFFSPVFRPPVASFYGEAVAFALGLAAVACMLLRPLWGGLQVPRIALLFLGFSLLMVAQTGAVYPQLNLLGALYMLWAAALAIVAHRLGQVLDRERMIAVLCGFLAAGALLSSVIGLIQLAGVQFPVPGLLLPQVSGRVYANTGQPNHLATYLCLGWASVSWLYATRRLSLGLAIAALLPMLPVLAASGSRSVLLYALAFLALSGWLLHRQPGVTSRRLLATSAALVVGLLLAAFLLDLVRGAIDVPLQTVGDSVAAKGSSSGVRLRFWNGALMMLQGSPLFGVGFREFGWNYFLLTAQVPGLVTEEGIIDHAHNVVLQVGAEFGGAGLLVLLGGLAWWLRAALRAKFDANRWWLFAGLWVLGLHSMLEYPLWYSYFLGVAAVLLGMAEPSAFQVGSQRAGRAVWAAVVLLGVMAFANVFQDYRLLQQTQRLQARAEAPDSHAATMGRLLELQGRSLFAPLVELGLTRAMSLDAEHLQDKIVLNGRVLRYLPTNDVAYRQAVLLAIAGDEAGMREAWDRAAANYPADRAEARSFVAQRAAGEPALGSLMQYMDRSNQEQGN